MTHQKLNEATTVLLSSLQNMMNLSNKCASQGDKEKFIQLQSATFIDDVKSYCVTDSDRRDLVTSLCRKCNNTQLEILNSVLKNIGY